MILRTTISKLLFVKLIETGHNFLEIDIHILLCIFESGQHFVLWFHHFFMNLLNLWNLFLVQTLHHSEACVRDRDVFWNRFRSNVHLVYGRVSFQSLCHEFVFKIWKQFDPMCTLGFAHIHWLIEFGKSSLLGHIVWRATIILRTRPKMLVHVEHLAHALRVLQSLFEALILENFFLRLPPLSHDINYSRVRPFGQSSISENLLLNECRGVLRYRIRRTWTGRNRNRVLKN